MKKTARERLEKKKEPKRVKLEKNFGGMKAGDTMFVATPLIVDNWIKTIPRGETRTVPEMRQALAQQNQCDGACPLSSSIFVRMSAEAALEDMTNGTLEDQVTPFWRIISSADKMAAKLGLDPAWLDDKRENEAG